MSEADQRAARETIASGRPLADRLGRADRDPEDQAADVIELWSVTQTALRALAGGSSMSGRDLVTTLRQRNLITIDQAHAAIELKDARDRAADRPDGPEEADVEAALSAFSRLEHGFLALEMGAPQLADTTDFVSLDTPKNVPLPDQPTGRRVEGRRSKAVIIGALLAAVLAAIVLAVVLRPDWFSIGGTPPDVERGIAAYREGRLAAARSAFEEAARDNPDLALPYVWLGRVARDERDDLSAARAFSRAEQLEPENALVHREIGAFHLARGRLQPAAERYVRAVQLAPDDRVSQGWLACVMHRQGRVDVARNFAQRAGSGPWTTCLATPPGSGASVAVPR
ncbi:MAG: tetratricopeptide repeat protein [Gemmatimonadaceae bacterium]